MTYISLEKAQELGDNFWSYAAMLEADQQEEDEELKELDEEEIRKEADEERGLEDLLDNTRGLWN